MSTLVHPGQRESTDRTRGVRCSRRRSFRSLAGAVLFLALGSVWQMVAAPGVSAAQTDLTFISSSTWSADPAAGRVHVLASITATSRATDADGRRYYYCLLYTSDAADEEDSVDLGGRRIIK